MPVWTSLSPSSEPLLLADVKNYLRVPSSVTADDDFIEGLITEAREYVERFTGRALINRAVTEYFDFFPKAGDSNPRVLSLYRGPVSAVTSVSYVPDGGTPDSYTTWDNTSNSKYFVDFASGANFPGACRINLRDGVDWPTIEPYVNAVKVVYTAGYGADGSTVPGPLKRAMYRLIGRWYYSPEETDDNSLVSELLNPYKLHK